MRLGQEIQALPRQAQLSGDVVRVVVGLLGDARGRLLVNQRPRGTHMAGAWEFPGGKQRAGESAEGALVRELAEELGIAVEQAEPFMRIEHAYPDRRVLLEIFRVRAFSGDPRALEGQALKWLSLAELESVGLLEADRPILDELGARARVSTGSA